MYESGAQRKTFAYHTEIGVDAWSVKYPIEWVTTNRATYSGDVENESRRRTARGHSACTAPKALDDIYGAARSARLVVAKMPDLSPGSIGEVFSTIQDHIVAHGRQGRCVVSVSWGSSKSIIDDKSTSSRMFWNKIHAQLRELAVVGGALSVFAAGTQHISGSRGSLVEGNYKLIQSQQRMLIIIEIHLQ